MLCHAVAHGVAANAKHARSPRNIAFRLLQRRLDGPPFDFRQARGDVRGWWRLDALHRLRELDKRKVRHRDAPVAGRKGRLLHGIAQFPHVTGPRMGEQPRLRVRR